MNAFEKFKVRFRRQNTEAVLSWALFLPTKYTGSDCFTVFSWTDFCTITIVKKANYEIYSNLRSQVVPGCYLVA